MWRSKATQVITVNPVPGGITFSGAPLYVKAYQRHSPATRVEVRGAVVINVATVNADSGVVTGQSAGTTTITYTVTNTCGTASQTTNITVQDAGTISSLSGLSSVCKDSTLSLITSGTAGGTWSSSASGIASVNADSGVVTGKHQELLSSVIPLRVAETTRQHSL